MSTDDWDKLTDEQRKAVDAVRKRMNRHLIAETEAFYEEHPELKLTWSFEADVLVRDGIMMRDKTHPISLPDGGELARPHVESIAPETHITITLDGKEIAQRVISDMAKFTNLGRMVREQAQDARIREQMAYDAVTRAYDEKAWAEQNKPEEGKTDGSNTGE